MGWGFSHTHDGQQKFKINYINKNDNKRKPKSKTNEQKKTNKNTDINYNKRQTHKNEWNGQID